MTDTFKKAAVDEAFERWTPAADIVEEENRLIVRAEMPGVDKDSISVELEGDELRVEARRERQAAPDGFTLVYAERPASPVVYRRAFSLGPDVRRDGISAAYEDGVLTVTLEKTERPKPRRIQVS